MVLAPELLVLAPVLLVPAPELLAHWLRRGEARAPVPALQQRPLLPAATVLVCC
jgi:hypothetical protein